MRERIEIFMTLPFGVLPLLTSQSVVITGSPLEIPGQSTSAKCMNVEYYVLIINSILIPLSFCRSNIWENKRELDYGGSSTRGSQWIRW